MFIREVDAEYRRGAPNLADLGARLYSWLDDPAHRWLERVLSNPAALHIDVDEHLRHLPWELLCRDGVFLCSNPHRLFTPVRRVGHPPGVASAPLFATAPHPANRPLRILFMASSPENVTPVLDFEREEALILDATQRHPIELIVEESGSIEGLRDRIDAHDAGYFDVLHLSGHADVIDGVPCFMVEDETGRSRLVTTDDFGRAFSGNWPRLVFLSGCRTGQAVNAGALPSLAEALIRVGAHAVLGWALPVGDAAASLAASALYDRLAVGKRIDEAVAYSRQSLFEKPIIDWHLLRLYAGTTPLGALVTPEHTPERERIRVRAAHAEFLDASTRTGARVEVCPRERFVGRRRLLQRALQVLRSREGASGYAEGLLLHGLGGIGKSSVAARLCERMPDHSRLIWKGAVDEIALLGTVISHYPETAEILNRAFPLKARVQQAFLGPLARRSVLFVFDDFEHNFTKTNIAAGPAPAALDVLDGLLAAIRETASDSRVIVTCRYAFPLPGPARLHHEMVETMRGADLRKKVAQLDRLRYDAAVDARLRIRGVDLAGGNPRLLERLDRVLADPGTNVVPILGAMAATAEEFREEIFLQELIEQQAKACREMMALLAVVALPVNREAVVAIVGGNVDPHLSHAAKVGLIEASVDSATAEKCYAVPELVKPALEGEISGTAQGEAVRRSVCWLYDAWRKSASESRVLELHRLALVAGEQEIAGKMVDVIAQNWCSESRFREVASLCRRTLQMGDDYRVLNWLGRAEEVLGSPAQAKQHFEKALELCPGKDDSQIARRGAILNSIASVYMRVSQFDDALRFAHDAIDLAKLAGSAHAEATALHNIACLHAQRGDATKAFEFLQRAQALEPEIQDSATLNSTAVILAQKSRLEDALDLLNTAIALAERGRDYRGKAVLLNNMAALIAQHRGHITEAVPLWREALALSEAVGDVPLRACVLGHLGWASWKSGDPAQAREFSLDAARIFASVGDWPRLVGLLGDLATRNKTESIIFLAQALWLCVYIGIGVPLEAVVRTSSALVRALGVQNDLSPPVAMVAVLAVEEREGHGERAKLEQVSVGALIACARARNIPDGEIFNNWLRNDVLASSPPEFYVRMLNELRALVPKDAWVFRVGRAPLHKM